MRPVTAREVGLKQMTVVVEFDSYEIALAAYESEDYKKALAVLGSGVERNFRIDEGASEIAFRRGGSGDVGESGRKAGRFANAHSCDETA